MWCGIFECMCYINKRACLIIVHTHTMNDCAAGLMMTLYFYVHNIAPSFCEIAALSNITQLLAICSSFH